MVHGVTQLLLVLISTCLFSLYCFCLGWRHGLVEDRQTSLLLEAPGCVAEVVWKRGTPCVALWDAGSAWLLPFPSSSLSSRDETPCQRCRGLHPPAPAPKLTLHTTLGAHRKNAVKEISIPLAVFSV